MYSNHVGGCGVHMLHVSASVGVLVLSLCCPHDYRRCTAFDQHVVMVQCLIKQHVMERYRIRQDLCASTRSHVFVHIFCVV